MIRPDYAGGSLLNLVATLSAACGGTPRHRLLDALPVEQLAGAKNVVLLIIDGLGDGFLARHGAGGALAAHRRASITSVFPSTTASAITTSYTGWSPAEHGLTGWFTYFSAAAGVAAPLPFVRRGPRQSLAARGVTAGELFAAPSLFDALPVESHVVTARSIIDSIYNRHHCGGATLHAYDHLDGLVDGVERAVKSGDARKFVYAYWPDYDAVSHQWGHESPQALTQLAAIDDAFAQLLRRLSGTGSVLVATADHGFLDSEREHCFDLDDGPGLAGLLRYPLCGERRIAWCHVQRGREAEFIDRARDWLGDAAAVRPSRELADEGWFGPGAAHPQLAERIGDVSLMMREPYTIKDWVPGESRHLHIGNHGGASEAEMRVPLITTSL